MGRGGMGSKIDAAQRAISQGVRAVVIASGFKHGVIKALMKGRTIGTLFANNSAHGEEEDITEGPSSEDMANAAREGSRQLQSLTSLERQAILMRIAKDLTGQSEKLNPRH